MIAREIVEHAPAENVRLLLQVAAQDASGAVGGVVLGKVDPVSSNIQFGLMMDISC